MRVLVVEDSIELLEIVAQGLRDHGFAVDIAPDGANALEQTAVNRYDVVVLDRDLPQVHGDDVCRAVVAGDGQTKVLMLTAAGTIDDRVSGLNLGADDYLPKPFAFAELVARIQALGRRAHPALPPVLTHADVALDTARRTVTRGGRPLALTGKEFGMLQVLLGARGAVVTSEELLEKVWDAHADPFTNTVRTTLSRLRRKLGTPELIETITGAGYRLR
ncbi:response regulator transcription factor [Streptomyces sp. TS71-3]|uniref:response regulator transcription factor n=1 Tax=Streptomyces sp. TS71-3 TaxID=2733862 RepID=UPI001B0DA5F3|nr:response regulator transcription factor [Streptomyces sp. TS71-3]GHJ35328.1 DNA-binding response regulator [Streptomyces sp. TS71-3]